MSKIHVIKYKRFMYNYTFTENFFFVPRKTPALKYQSRYNLYDI